MTGAAVKRGVVYCALKIPEYLEAAVISAFALRQLEPELPIVLLTDFAGVEGLGLERFNITVKRIVLPEVWRLPDAMESRLVKTSLPELVEFDETLYLDADVLPIQPLQPIWEFLQRGVISLAIDVNKTLAQCDHVGTEEKAYTLQRCPADSVQFNSGVMLWRRCPEVLGLFETWKEEWIRFQRQDQLALLRAIQATAIKLVELPEVYNFPAYRVTPDVIERNEVRLLHCLKGFVRIGRFRAIAQRLMPTSTALALEVLKQKRSFWDKIS
ncbi:hypothetical protein K9N68_39180 (plasmid) [Kovacikia minuta CCNUW1]|uniref:hypothetical protein n=1 Tax=Kovacikia minuta TaxID=2931930 RepID=UPI001CC9BD69|nr:hypothetical protein [Kovacikia minuta]UBF30168.1 hypothetical protein K9N68_39180 [Kovacikia minuta CCNUW1]